MTMKSSTVTCTGPRYTCSAAYVEVPNALPVSLAAAVIVYLCKLLETLDQEALYSPEVNHYMREGGGKGGQ